MPGRHRCSPYKQVSPGGAGGYLFVCAVYLLGLAVTMLLKSLTAVPFTATIL